MKNKCYICSVITDERMNIKFDKKYLKELYYTEKCSDKKHRFQPQVVRNYIKCIFILAEAPNIEVLFPMRSLNYEVLSAKWRQEGHIPLSASTGNTGWNSSFRPKESPHDMYDN